MMRLWQTQLLSHLIPTLLQPVQWEALEQALEGDTHRHPYFASEERKQAAYSFGWWVVAAVAMELGTW